MMDREQQRGLARCPNCSNTDAFAQLRIDKLQAHIKRLEAVREAAKDYKKYLPFTENKHVSMLVAAKKLRVALEACETFDKMSTDNNVVEDIQATEDKDG